MFARISRPAVSELCLTTRIGADIRPRFRPQSNHPQQQEWGLFSARDQGVY